MYFYFTYLPFLINLILLFVKKSKAVIAVMLISTILGSLFPGFGLLFSLSGKEIGFGNPDIGIDWGFVLFFLAELLFLWKTLIFRIVK